MTQKVFALAIAVAWFVLPFNEMPAKENFLDYDDVTNKYTLHFIRLWSIFYFQRTTWYLLYLVFKIIW